MDVAVGVRGAVMEYESGAVFSRLRHFPVEVYLLPAGKHVLFLDGQVASHGKGRLREVQCVFVIHGGTILAEIESNPAGSVTLGRFLVIGKCSTFQVAVNPLDSNNQISIEWGIYSRRMKKTTAPETQTKRLRPACVVPGVLRVLYVP